MARGGFNGFGSVVSAFEFRFQKRAAGHFVTQPVQPVVRSYKILLLLLSVCLLACWLAPYALAQDDDVHITPRETKKADPAADPSGIADPALRTHTKPIKKEVDLVLVPVTVTDPMNRLVTGLEKDNFQLTTTASRRRSGISPVKMRRFRWA